jgi:xanthine dehydrogenase accessory factor
MKDLPYIGMIGSPKKVEIIVDNLRKRGVLLDKRVYAPVGLKIGRNLPQDIALAVLSEIRLIMEGGALEHFRIDWWNRYAQ